MNREKKIYSSFANSLNGDDGAYYKGYVYCKDLFVEKIHFKREWLSLKQIAQKSLLVNISDAISMNAKPKFALLGLELPKDITNKEIKELTLAFKKEAKKWGISIIGGDTVSGDRIAISITLISKCKKPLFRSGAKVGDLVAFSGDLGSVKKDLQSLQKNKKISPTSKFIRPKIRAKFMQKAAPFLNSAMDISDSLGSDLKILLKKSKVGVKFLKKPTKEQFLSAEEYELLFTFCPKNLKKVKKIAKKTKTKLTIFAKITKKKKREFISPKPHHF